MTPTPPHSHPSIPTALTIAGSDSGGGAGLQADLKAFQANGVYGMSVVTAVTAQNSQGVTAAFDLPTDLVTAQLDAVVDDFPIGAVKTGMLSSAVLIETVADGLERHRLTPVVVDPVMISTSGFALLQPDDVEALTTRMLPLADLLTPNTHEAEALAGFPVRTLTDARRAAEALVTKGSRAVLVKGGHLEGEGDAVDVLVDAEGERLYRAPRIDTPHTHGTGCTYASAIAANLAKGFALREAIARAKTYLTEAIRHALPLGHGHGPTHHFWFLTGEEAVSHGG
ncbi:MAG: bifunctional hydroxymethylpyrimidine kinase/phosphomethylpyrimidine kinase [Rhodothermaceae bacterium]|nr:bifunctional hydroxymethylpyrimidine kinase/phosphomethylpyrimidine kinase [Rhodothermaceae bacterium]